MARTFNRTIHKPEKPRLKRGKSKQDQDVSPLVDELRVRISKHPQLIYTSDHTEFQIDLRGGKVNVAETWGIVGNSRASGKEGKQPGFEICEGFEGPGPSQNPD